MISSSRQPLTLPRHIPGLSMGLVPTGYDGDTDMLETAKNINVLAKSVFEEMDKKCK